MMDPSDIKISHLCPRDGSYFLRIEHVPTGLALTSQRIPPDADPGMGTRERERLLAELGKQIAEREGR
jgi:hypothetical protein